MPLRSGHIVVISDDDDASNTVRPRTMPSTRDDWMISVGFFNPSSDLCQDDLIDPCPDVHALFQEYNRKHFENQITHTYVEYSRRMTSCAGTCTFTRTGCRIALSEPLLKLRPVSDLKSTLLHEMIHAFLFLTQGMKRDGPDGHGPMFMHHADRINRSEFGVEITPYHTFHEEVESYRVHHWRCDKCGRIIKRAMNRAPAPTDYWWSSHARSCAGVFVKIAGPERKPKSKRAPKLGAIGVDDKSAKKKTRVGVMKTMRIDQLMGRRDMKQKTRDECTNCPMCDAKIDKELLNKHLQVCIPPELLLTQTENITKDNTNHAPFERKGSSPEHLFTEGTEKHCFTEAIEIPESPSETVGAKHSSSSRTSPNSKRHRSAGSFLMEDVIDVDALTAIAINPSGKTFAEINKAATPGPMTAEQTKTRNDVPDLRTMLKSFLEPEEPIDLEEKAISKLKEYFNEHNEKKPFSFYEAAKMLKIEQGTLLDSVRRGATVSRDGDMQITREARDLLFPSRSQNDLQLGKRITGNGTKRRPLTTAIESESNLKTSSPPFSRKCPLCEVSISNTSFDGHVSTCLKESNIPSVLMDKEINGEEEETILRSECVRSNIAGTKCATFSGDKDGQSIVNCPICDVGKIRSELESHVASCLRTTGLLDAL
ncbi:unnamed protein product [Agarophyton chilense]